jgi:hypothetical protein
MNETKIKKAARAAESAAVQISANYPILSAEEIGLLGADIKRAGNVIQLEAIEPVEPPWEPEPEPDPEPPSVVLPVPIVVPDLPPFAQTIEKNGGSCIVVKGDGQTYRNKRVRYGQWMGFDIPKQDPGNGTRGFMLDECQLETGWAGDYKGWGVRGYDMAQFHYRRTSFLCTNPYAKNIEHGSYMNIYGGGLLEDCFWLNIPGQASQYVWSGRATESSNFTGLSGLDVAGDVVRYVNGQMHNCGHWGNGRASFVISMFKGQVGLTLENHLIQKTNEPQTHGAVLFQGNNRETLQLLNTRIYFTGTPDREMVQCTNAKAALVDGGEYHQAKGFRFMDCGQVEIKNAKGTAPVWVGKNGVWHTKTTLAAMGPGTIL